MSNSKDHQVHKLSNYQQKIENTHYTIVYNGDQSTRGRGMHFKTPIEAQGDKKQLIHVKSICER